MLTNLFVQTLLDEKAKDVQDKTGKVANLTAYCNVVEQGIAHAEKFGICMLCERPFGDANETANFCATQRNEVTVELPKAQAVHDAELKQANDVVAALMRARPLWEECQKLKERDIPKAEELHKSCVLGSAGASGFATDAMPRCAG